MDSYFQYYDLAKNTMENAIVHAIPQVYAASFGALVSGDWRSALAGLLIIIGITSLVLRGLWKMILSVFGRSVFRAL